MDARPPLPGTEVPLLEDTMRFAFTLPGWLTGLLLLSLCGLPAAAGVTANPFDASHVILLRPGDFAGPEGTPLAKAAEGHYFGQLAAIETRAVARVKVRYAGEYVLWVRAVAEKTPRPLSVALADDGVVALQGTINDGAGSAARGGRAAFTAYREQAIDRGGATPDGAPADPEAGLDGVDQTLIDEMNAQGHLRWVSTARIDEVRADAPAYWWKLGPVALQPAHRYTLTISGGPARLSCAVLTTSQELVYPFCGDFDAPAGSYLRFRIDGFPAGKKDVLITGSILHHSYPTYWTAADFTPDGFRDNKPAPFTQTGYTRWFRLQDLKYISAAPTGHCHLSLAIPPGAKGATQFANLPLADYVAREFTWDEPEGKRISMFMDFDRYPQELRTFRDHAAANYDLAAATTGDRLFPLARGKFYTTTYGSADGPSGDYFMQTARILGTNVGPGNGQQSRYGWWTMGPAAVDLSLPFDEAAAAQHNLALNREMIAAMPETERRTARISQMADEPEEFQTTELSAPLWRFYPAEQAGPKWADLTGGSYLYTKKTDYHNCVLEGAITMLGGNIGFRVGFANYDAPAGGSWLLGRVAQGPVNFQAARDGVPFMTILHKEMPLVANKPLPFKIVYARDTATLYLGGVLLNRISELRTSGGFAIIGAQKALTSLRLRPMTAAERADALPPNNDPDAVAEDDPEADEPVFAPGAELPDWAREKPLDVFVREDWAMAGGIPGAREGFVRWLQRNKVTLETLKVARWEDVHLLTVKELVESETDRHLYYWSRRYSNYLTPKAFQAASDGIQAAYGNPDMVVFTGLSGHSLYFPSKMPLDMFQLGQYDGMTPGISDWMTFGGWRWDNHQAVAYSVATFNAGARVYGGTPHSTPMMHCGWPTTLRSFTEMANNVKFVSFFLIGPCYIGTEWFWGEMPSCYTAVHTASNSANLTDDLLAPGLLRPSRVALLYSMATENWDPTSSFADKRATFLALSHDYFPAELVTEEQVAAGALAHYDALYVLDPYVTAAAQGAIDAWVKAGGLLWTCADALRWNEYQEPSDLLQRGFGLQRTWTTAARDTRLIPAAGETALRAQATPPTPVDTVAWTGATVRARYGDGRAAWLEKAAGKGRVVYLAHRGGVSYSQKSIAPVAIDAALDALWGDFGRVPITTPLFEAKFDRELTLSEPDVMATPLDSAGGTLIVMHNMQNRPLANLRCSLKAAAKPVSVEYVKDLALTPVPFSYENGRVAFTLPVFDGPAMVAVRAVPAPADDRQERIRANTLRLFASAEPGDLAAAAWFAGLSPQWKLGDRLLPLLANADPSVRRCAAEACGRLQLAAAAAPLARQLEEETDAHVLAYGAQALARLGDSRFPALALRLAKSGEAFTVQHVLMGVRAYVTRIAGRQGLDKEETKLVRDLCPLIEGNPDRRVRDEYLRLLGAAIPGRCLELLAATDDAADRALLVEIVARDEQLLAAYCAKPVGEGRALLALAQQRTDPRLAGLMTAGLDALIALDPSATAYGALRQRHEGLARALFAKRAAFPENQRVLPLMVLDGVFGAHLGNDAAGWEAWLAARK